MVEAAVRVIRVGILAFDEMELLDFAGPYEVFTTASRVCARIGHDVRFVVQTVGQSNASVRARAGLQIVPDVDMLSADAYDVLIIPGGVVTAVLREQTVLNWIEQMHARTQITASICTGAFVLAQAGVIRHRATTHWEDLEDLRARHPHLQVHDAVRWVADDASGRVYSSAGISAGIDLSLHLVARLAGVSCARATARQMDYRADGLFNDITR